MAAYLKIGDIKGESFSDVVEDLATSTKTDLKIEASDLAFLRELAKFISSDDIVLNEDIVINLGILDHDTGAGRLKANGPTDTLQFIKFDGGWENIAEALETFSLNFEEIKYVEFAKSLKLLFNEGHHNDRQGGQIVGTDLTFVDDFLL